MEEIFRGTNTLEHWEHKHVQQYEVNREFDYSQMEGNQTSYMEVAKQIMVQNRDAVEIKKILDVGCATGKAIKWIKKNLPEFECEGWDFSSTGINAAMKKAPECTFQCRDFLLNPITENYGFITSMEVIEHIEEGRNYEFLNNILEHCEYAIISTVTTPDDCFGEHISHYTFNTFEEKGYDVLWKAKLSRIDLSNIGLYDDYHYVIFLIKGKL